MAQSLAPLPPRGEHPATLEGVASFRMKTAALSRPAAPMKGNPDIVLLTAPDGGVVVYPPSDKLIILAARRRRTTHAR
ncbi:MAG: hypothetical protein ACREH4_04305 [Vitreimonas sp.]